MSNPPARRMASVLTVTLAAALSCACVTTDVIRERAASGASVNGSVAVTVYRSPSSIGRGPFDRRVDTRLLRSDDTGQTIVLEGAESHWSVQAVTPGRYTLQVLGWARSGGAYRARSSPAHESFVLHGGETVQIHVFLSDKRGVLWTALGTGIAAGAVGVAVTHTK